MWEAQFNLIYNSKGGINIQSLEKMSKKKFLFLLKRLAEQKKAENDALKKHSKGIPSSSNRPTDRRKFLGKL